MVCDGCGNKNAHRLSYRFDRNKVSCDSCGGKSNFTFNDVFFRQPYYDEHLADANKSPLGVYVKSREHKAMLMKEQRIREGGDRIHGAR